MMSAPERNEVSDSETDREVAAPGDGELRGRPDSINHSLGFPRDASSKQSTFQLDGRTSGRLRMRPDLSRQPRVRVSPQAANISMDPPGMVSWESWENLASTLRPLRSRWFNGGLHAQPDFSPTAPDLVCFSQLRWDFVYQRPQHLMTRCALERRVFFVEEPRFGPEPSHLEISPRDCGVSVVVPHLPIGIDRAQSLAALRHLVDALLREQGIREFGLWYWSSLAFGYTDHLDPRVVVYDCVEELSALRSAPPELADHEHALLKRADLVFTAGQGLYESRRERHANIHPIANSVDVAHFAQARMACSDPADQQGVGGPRIGFFGVIDDRLDLSLIARVAAHRPDWQLVMIGPEVGSGLGELPRGPNLHYLGKKDYEALPRYLAGWNVAWLPYRTGSAERLINPMRTPEYLAAGRAVVSSHLPDVVKPFGEQGLVRLAKTAEQFVAEIQAALEEAPEERLRKVDAFLAQTSWESAWNRMTRLIEAAVDARYDRQAHAVSLETKQGMEVAAGTGLHDSR